MRALNILLSCIFLHVARGQIYLLCDDFEFTTEDSCSCFNPPQPIISCPSAKLTSIPNITKVHTLQLNNNTLSSLRAEELSHLRGLTNLDIANNRIGDVSVFAFSGVESSLEWLDLSGNRLGAIPAIFGMDNDSMNLQTHGSQILTKLDVLKLSNNYIYSIEKNAFKGVPGLRELHLDGNPVNHIAPDGWMGPPGLRYLAVAVSNMDISRIPTDNLHLLISLHVHGAKPMRLDLFSKWFEAFPLLQHLKLEDMGLEDDHLYKGSFPSSIRNKLRSISFKDNKLTKPPYRLLSQLTLRELDLSGNMMRRVDHYSNIDTILMNLYKLNMANNLITWVNANFLLSLHRVREVDLRNNYMSSMYWRTKQIDENLPYQAVFLLGKNRWRCNCSEKWLRELVERQVNTHNGHLSRDDIYSDLRCGSSPAEHRGKLVVDVPLGEYCSSLS